MYAQTYDFLDPNILFITPAHSPYIKGKGQPPILEIDYSITTFTTLYITGPIDLMVGISLYSYPSNTLIADRTTTVSFPDLVPGGYIPHTQFYEFLLDTTPLPSGNYYFRIILDPDKTVLETDENNNEFESQLYQLEFVILSGVLNFGHVKTFLDNAYFAPTPVTCPVGTKYLLSFGNGTWSSSWDAINLLHNNLCVYDQTSDDGYSVDLIVSAGSTLVGNMKALAGGLDVALSNVSLDKDGGHYTNGIVELPDNVTVHEDKSGEPAALGLKNIPFGAGSFLSDPSNMIFSDSIKRWFHSYGLPFWINSNGMELELDPSSSKIEIYSPVISYIHKARYSELHPDDIRGNNGLPSNDILFFSESNVSDAIITQGGLRGGFTFSGWDNYGPPSFTQCPHVSYPKVRSR